MLIRRLIAGMMLLAFVLGPSARASQSSIVMPSAGPMSMATFVGTYLNPALQSIFTCNSGGTAPTNGPGASSAQFQCWWDTSATPYQIRYYDGAAWPSAFSLDPSTHSISLSTSELVTAHVATSYTIVDADKQRLHTFSNGSSQAVAIGQAGTGGNFAAGWFLDIQNLGAGALTLTPVTSTIDGGSSFVLQKGQGIRLISDGANYQIWRGFAPIAFTAPSHQFFNAINSVGQPAAVRPACADLSDASPSCNVDATNASNLSTGTLPAGRLPNPSATTLGGIQSIIAVAHKWINGISTSGVPSLTQPGCSDLSDAAPSCNTDTTTQANVIFTGLSTAAAAADADTFATNQGAGNLKQTFAAVKTWIKGWIAKADVGLSNVDNTSDATKNAATATLTNKTLTAPVINSPTGIVKADVGLNNVDNTSDATKNAASVTLTNKTLTAPVINSPTGIVKADVGLSNVDNTSDAAKNAASVTLTNKSLTAPIITGLEDVQGATKYSTQSAPAQIAADQNDYNPSSVVCASSGTLLINSNAAHNVTGIAGGVAGCQIALINNGSFTITLKEQNASSSAANRFNTGGDVSLLSAGGVLLRYDGVASRWRLVGTSSGGSGGGSGTVTSVACDNGIDCSTITTSGTVKGGYRHNFMLPL